MPDLKLNVSKTGLFFIILYFVLSVIITVYAIHLTSFKSQIVFLSIPIGFVPQEIFNLLPSGNYEGYVVKERYLIKLVSHYPVGMAFMSVFLYAFGWFLEVIFEKNWKVAAISVSTYLVLFMIFGKHFFTTWPLFVVLLGVISWLLKRPKQSSSN